MGTARARTRERKKSADIAQSNLPTALASKQGAQAAFAQVYEQLNAEQRRAVDTIEGPVMVLSGPGTGKTQTLAMRIANILQQTQMDPWNILCLTFTESGVVAMRERLTSIIGTAAYSIRIHTFHSFCNDIIQDHPDIFAVSRSWQVLSDVERIQYLREILDELPGTSPLKPFGAPYLFLKDIINDIQDLKQEDISPQRFAEILDTIERFVDRTQKQLNEFYALKASERSDETCLKLRRHLDEAASNAQLPPSLAIVLRHYFETYQQRLTAAETKRAATSARTAFKNSIKRWHDRLSRQLPKQRHVTTVYEAYQQKLHERGRYDYEDMILMVLERWKHDAQLLRDYQERFQYILVDEYQDTNGAQNEVVELLGSYDDQPNLFVVGDDKQSIYRFQGASLNNMLAFYERYHTHVQVVTLQENYRSQEVVLTAASAVIANNQESLARYIPGGSHELVPKAGLPAAQFELHEFQSPAAEEYFIAQRAKELIENGVSPSEIAVLFRYNRDGRELLRQLRTMGVPARLEAGENVLEDTLVQQFLTTLRYLEHPTQGYLLAQMLHWQWWRLPALETLKVIHFAGRERRGLLDILSEEKSLQRAGVADPVPWQRVPELLASWRKLSRNTSLQNFLYHVLTESGLLDWIVEEQQQPSALQKLAAVLDRAKELHRTSPNPTLSAFIADITLLQEHELPLSVEAWQGAEEAVRLMTAHKAKGLEFEHVFIMRLNDKHWGNNPEPNKVSLPHGLVRFDTVVAQENNEDERRLFYVAVTRAKRQVYLTRALHQASGRETAPTLFLQEIPASCLAPTRHAETEGEATTRLRQTIRPLPAAAADTKEWIRGLLRRYVVSVTHVNNYLTCPHKFYIKNLLQVPAARTQHQALGTAVHGALHDFFVTWRRRGKLPTKPFLLSAFAAHLQREMLSESELKDASEVGRAQLADYFDHYRRQLTRESLSEYDFRAHGVHVGDIPITGKIDKVELLDAKALAADGNWKAGAPVNVVDYKTGRPETGLRKLKAGEDYYRQLVFYKLLCDESPEFSYEMISGEVDFIKASDKQGFIKKRIEVSDADAAELKEILAQVWADIQALKFLEDGAACGECDVCKKQSEYSK